MAECDVTAGVTASIADVLGDLVDGVCAIERMISCLTAARAEAIDATRRWCEATDLSVAPTGGPRWDSGTTARRVLVTEIGAALRLPDGTAEALVIESEALMRELPATLASLRAGRISYRHAACMVDQASTLPGGVRADFEAAVLPDAERLTVAKFDRRARIRRERLHPESIAARHAVSVADRNIRSQPGRDGMAWLTAYLPAPSIAGIMTRTDSIAESLCTPDEARTVTQLRADVFSDLLIFGFTRAVAPANPQEPTGGPTATHDGAGSTGSGAEASRRCGNAGIGEGVVARVLVTVPVLTLLGSEQTPGTLEGYGPIDAHTARLLAASAPSFTRLLTHPETGTVLSVGRDRYAVPADLRTWLRVRDATCRFPGCGRSAARCDIDHSIDWQFDGHTSQDNLAHLCRRHHSLKHQTAWSVEHIGGGTLRWTSPGARRYTTEPDTGLPTAPPF